MGMLLLFEGGRQAVSAGSAVGIPAALRALVPSPCSDKSPLPVDTGGLPASKSNMGTYFSDLWELYWLCWLGELILSFLPLGYGIPISYVSGKGCYIPPTTRAELIEGFFSIRVEVYLGDWPNQHGFNWLLILCRPTRTNTYGFNGLFSKGMHVCMGGMKRISPMKMERTYRCEKFDFD